MLAIYSSAYCLVPGQPVACLHDAYAVHKHRVSMFGPNEDKRYSELWRDESVVIGGYLVSLIPAGILDSEYIVQSGSQMTGGTEIDTAVLE